VPIPTPIQSHIGTKGFFRDTTLIHRYLTITTSVGRANPHYLH